MRRALAEYTVLGIHTTLPFFDRVLRHPDFVAGDFDTGFVEPLPRRAADASRPRRRLEVAVVAAAIARLRGAPGAPAGRRRRPRRGGSAWRAQAGATCGGERVIFDATVDGRAVRVEVRAAGAEGRYTRAARRPRSWRWTSATPGRTREPDRGRPLARGRRSSAADGGYRVVLRGDVLDVELRGSRRAARAAAAARRRRPRAGPGPDAGQARPRPGRAPARRWGRARGSW